MKPYQRNWLVLTMAGTSINNPMGHSGRNNFSSLGTGFLLPNFGME